MVVVKRLMFVLFTIVLLVASTGCIKDANNSGSENEGAHLKVVGNYSNGQVLIRASFMTSQNEDALKLIMEWAESHDCRVVSINGATYHQQYSYYAVLDCANETH